MPLTRCPKADADTVLPLPPAPRRTPVLEAQTGLFTRAWATWFDLLWKRTGEAHAPSNAELDEALTGSQEALAALQAELDATQAELAATQADLTQAQAAVTALQTELDGTQADLAQTQAELEQAQEDLTAVEAAQSATQAELDTTQAQLASDLPVGTAFRVARYQSDGVGVESSPLTVDTPGNLRLGTVTPGTSATRVVALASGVAPSAAHPADAVQLWVEDFDGVAGQASLSLRGESGRITRLGQGLITTRAVVATTTATTAAPYVLTEADSHRVCISNNTTAQAQFTLPGADTGLTYTFTLYAGASGLRVRVAAGDSIRGNGAVSAVGGAIETTTLYASLTLVAVNVNVWMVVAMVGTWAMVA